MARRKDGAKKKMCAYPYFAASCLARSSETIRLSNRSHLLPQITTSGESQYACVLNCSNQDRMLRNDCSFVTSNNKMNPMASRKKAVVRLRNRSCPAVSHSWRWIRWLRLVGSLGSGLYKRRFSRKSIPTVEMNLLLNSLSVNWWRKLVLPTPESPRARNFIKKS